MFENFINVISNIIKNLLYISEVNQCDCGYDLCDGDLCYRTSFLKLSVENLV